MNIWIDFLLRLLMFAIMFYYFLEYVLTCKVSTEFGLTSTILTIIIIFIVFKVYTCNNVITCTNCNSVLSKDEFKLDFL